MQALLSRHRAGGRGRAWCIGPAIVLIPVVIWAWFVLDTTGALLFTAYMVAANLLDILSGRL